MPWQDDWLAQVQSRKRVLWRGVEAQHRVATMRLVDDLDEQLLLEQLLEDSKPALPPRSASAHYLLATPFRYVSAWPSRFRRPDEPGAWYGADEPATVAAEVAYWRWRFHMDSDGLREQPVLTELTFFQAKFSGSELDLTQPPWSGQREQWRDPDDYASCHALAAHVRSLQPPVQAIRYESARAEGGMCEVVFDVHALAIPKPGVQQTWTCKTTAERVLLSHDAQRLQFDMK
ncbi:RES family NAD+ phosphorylase [Ramlibacter sp.]|uniref:RES family NAD+ phosphorylase n=1 Tax=Ramlibacter sp. TaxID=1917967 RepID=UPI00262EB681|nr:RES family NAD+ phosphorylase [Ramlibacter sp.]MDB5957736.1 hypothetical protein [Ramlibacter sp.]